MLDWVKLLEKFRRVVIQGVARPPVGHTGNVQLNVQLSLLQGFVRTTANQQTSKIATNFLAAAMHLAFLRSAAQEKLSVDFPDDAVALLDRHVPLFRRVT